MANEKVLELLKDKSFTEELGKAESAADAQKLFAAKGVDVSVDELLALRAKVKQEAGEELGDEELALVAGGGSAGTEAGEWVRDAAGDVSDFFKTVFSGW
jgi:hypothetical protein